MRLHAFCDARHLDWTDTNPETIFSNLKQQSDYYNYGRLTVPSLFSEAKKKGLRQTVSERFAWGRMNMSPTDIADVSGATYLLAQRECSECKLDWAISTRRTGPPPLHQRRFNDFFDVRTPGLQTTVVQADGNDVEPGHGA